MVFIFDIFTWTDNKAVLLFFRSPPRTPGVFMSFMEFYKKLDDVGPLGMNGLEEHESGRVSVTNTSIL